MEWVIIGVSVLAFLMYIFFYRFFGVDARIEMLVLHSLVFALIVAFAVLLWISIDQDLGAFAVTAAIAALAGFGTILLKYFLAEFGISRRS
ncbi:MAG: hypothetical protein JW852_12035 [Spirochaetales bacterium]|nr:hypothetical protein [Spirochaetales bacterium]